MGASQARVPSHIDLSRSLPEQLADVVAHFEERYLRKALEEDARPCGPLRHDQRPVAAQRDRKDLALQNRSHVVCAGIGSRPDSLSDLIPPRDTFLEKLFPQPDHEFAVLVLSFRQIEQVHSTGSAKRQCFAVGGKRQTAGVAVRGDQPSWRRVSRQVN